MKIYKNWDSLVWIIIWVFILSIALLWIINVLGFNKNTVEIYNNAISSYIMESNIKNIIKKLDNSNIDDENDFYIYKNQTTNNFEYKTWSVNKNYKYVNSLLDNIDPTINPWKTYKIVLNKKLDILKHVIKPIEIQNIVFWYDTGTWDLIYDDTTKKISQWIDLSWNSINANQTNDVKRPVYVYNWINWYSNILFEWSNILTINNNDLLNSSTKYNQKSSALVLLTWDDVSKLQII